MDLPTNVRYKNYNVIDNSVYKTVKDLGHYKSPLCDLVFMRY